MSPIVTTLQEELANRVIRQTGRRVQDLRIEIASEEVVLYGRTGTYHVKQLAQMSALELVPADLRLRNAIVVDHVRV